MNKKSTPISESANQTFGLSCEFYSRKTRKSCYFLDLITAWARVKPSGLPYEFCFHKTRKSNYLLDLITAWAPARRAAGTRNGEQDT